MASHHHVRVFWSGRTDPPDRLGYQAFLFLAALAGVHPQLAGFEVAPPEGKRPRPRSPGAPPPLADSPAACTTAVACAPVRWRTGARERLSFMPRFSLRANGVEVAHLALTFGIEPLDLGPIFAPNRLDLRIRASAFAPETTRDMVEDALRAAVAVFHPEWGHAGTDATPQEPPSIFSDGTPTVGWMTYLSAAYPKLPAELPSPAVAHAVADFGTIVVASPKAFDPRDPAQAAAVDDTARALRAAGVLVPFHRVSPQRAHA